MMIILILFCGENVVDLLASRQEKEVMLKHDLGGFGLMAFYVMQEA